MISINNISKHFSEKSVLNNVSLEVEQGEILGIVGQSGAGKSTLLRCINGLENYENGSITVMGKEIHSLPTKELNILRKNLSMIFQSFNLLERLNVYENIALPMKVWGYGEDDIKNKVKELLSLVGLEDKAKSKSRELSGGQKQRVAIARALSLNPKVLLCDEATSALDPNTTKSILNLLKKINEEFNITIVLVTHQMEVVKELCHRIAIMTNGEIKAMGKVTELFLKPASELETLLGYEDFLPKNQVNIRIFFSETFSQQCVITAMARELNINFSIVWGKLEKFRDDILGNLVINVEKEHKVSICNYLDNKAIPWEVA